MRFARSTALTAAAVIALPALAACGGSGSGSAHHGTAHHAAGPASGGKATAHASAAHASAVAALERVRKRTAGVHSAREDSAILEIGETWQEKGLSDWSHGALDDMTVTFGNDSAASTVSTLYDDPDGMRTRTVADAVYLRIGPAAAKKHGGRSWIKTAGVAGGVLPMTGPLLPVDGLTKVVATLLSAPDVRSAGTETVRGVRTTHYTGTLAVDPKAVYGQGKRQLSALDAVRQAMQSLQVTREKLDVWVAADGLPVKESTYGSAPHHSFSTTSVTRYYSDYGIKVQVTAPPAKDCVDPTTLR